MTALVILLFWNKDAFQWEKNFGSGYLKPVAATTVVLVGILPLLSLGGLWDKYLSFHLYSGKQQRIQLVMHETVTKKLPEEFHPYITVSEVDDSLRTIDMNDWALAELNVPAVSEDRIMLAWCRSFKKYAFTEKEVFFYRDYPNYLEERGWDQYTPREAYLMSKFPPLREKYIR